MCNLYWVSHLRFYSTKAGGSDNGTKVKVIRAKAYKYPVLKMCKILKISRSTYYSYEKPEATKDEINDGVIKIFNENQHVYGTRKLKVELAKRNYKVSRRRIARIMRYNGLISARKYSPRNDKVNNEAQPNLLDRQFDEKDTCEVVVSDLTYVRVGNDWNYIFHTDRGSEFKNYLIDDFLKESIS